MIVNYFDPKVFNSQYSQYYFTQLQEMKNIYMNILNPYQKKIYRERLSDIKSNTETVIIACFLADIFDRKNSISNFLLV